MLDPDISTAASLLHLHRAETDPFALDRRRFLQLVGMGMGAGLVAGPGTSLLDAALPGHDPAAWALGPLGPSDGILVVIGMFGGNDGLNTVVPFNDGLYYQQHGSLAIPGEQTLALDANAGLNPALSEFKRFWDTDQLAIIEGVGHQQQEFSHFQSMAKWMSGFPTGLPTSGWLGRWLDGYLNGSKDLYAAAEIGHSVPLHLQGFQASGTTVPSEKPSFGVPRDSSDASLFNTIRGLGAGQPADSWLGKVGQAQTDQLAIAKALSPIIPEAEDLSATEIVAKLEVAARLINANLGFRVITAGWGDFDSHAGQPQMHPVRMQELNAALQAFFATLHADWGNRVTVMTFSEFGRTSWDNDGAGTDHGSAAPQFVFGAKVKGGFYGQRPSLTRPSGAPLRRWERMAQPVSMLDYYGSVIDGWLPEVPGGSVLGSGYRQNLGLFNAGPSAEPTFPGLELGHFVALSPRRIYDTRPAFFDGRTTRIGPGETVKVQIAGLADIPADDVSAVAVNISSVRPNQTTYLTAYPTGYAKPLTASLNPRLGEIVPNMTVVGVGKDGTVSLYNNAGEVHVTIDLMGYFRKQVAARMAPLSPSRILDTRNNGAPTGSVRAGAPLVLQIAGQGGVPPSGVDAVVLNLTSVRPSTNGWVTAWPTGTGKPVVANLSYQQGDLIPNMVMCKVGPDGKINLEASHGQLDLVADVVGCFTTDGSMLSPLVPSRLLDTRIGNGAPEARLGPNAELQLQVTGRGGVPSTAKAVVLNVTGVRPDQRTYLTIYPTGEARPTAASLNPNGGAIAGNLVVAKIGAGGKVTIYNKNGSLNLTADVTGFFI